MPGFQTLRNLSLIVATLLGGASALAAEEQGKGGAVPDFAANPWVVMNGTEFHKVPGDNGPSPPGDLPGKPYVQNVNNRVVDVSNPILQPWAREIMQAENEKVLAGGVPFVSNSRCWPVGVPGFLIVPGEPVFYLQTPKEVWILNQRDTLIRRVFMNVPHQANPGYSWYGDEVGHYEGDDTLAIDTIGLDDKGPIDRYRTPHTKQLHVEERHTLTPDGKNIRVIFNLTDPGAFTMPWKGLVEFEHGREPRAGHWLESICNENSHDYFIDDNAAVPVPHAVKLDF